MHIIRWQLILILLKIEKNEKDKFNSSSWKVMPQQIEIELLKSQLDCKN